MANNRMYLRCACGEQLLIAKNHGWWGLWVEHEDFDRWVNEHHNCVLLVGKKSEESFGSEVFQLDFEIRGHEYD